MMDGISEKDIALLEALSQDDEFTTKLKVLEEYQRESDARHNAFMRSSRRNLKIVVVLFISAVVANVSRWWWPDYKVWLGLISDLCWLTAMGIGLVNFLVARHHTKRLQKELEEVDRLFSVRKEPQKSEEAE